MSLSKLDRISGRIIPPLDNTPVFRRLNGELEQVLPAVVVRCCVCGQEVPAGQGVQGMTPLRAEDENGRRCDSRTHGIAHAACALEGGVL